MAADPLIATIAAEDLDTPAAEAQAAVLEESHDEVLADAGIDAADKVQDYTNSLNGFSAVISHEEAVALGGRARRSRSSCPTRCATRPTDSSGEFLGLTQRGGAYRSGLTGEGVVVGVIDTGIWPEHPSFADDGIRLPCRHSPALPCEFGNTAHNPNDVAVHVQQQADRRAPDARHLPRRHRRRRRTSSTRPATTTVTARTPHRPPPATPASSRRSSAVTSGRSPASPRGHRSSPTRASATSAASRPTSRPRSTRRSPTASTSSTTRSAAARACSAATRSHSCSPPRSERVGRHLGRQQRAGRRHDRRSRRQPVDHDGRRQHAGSLLPGDGRARQPVVALGLGLGLGRLASPQSEGDGSLDHAWHAASFRSSTPSSPGATCAFLARSMRPRSPARSCCAGAAPSVAPTRASPCSRRVARG